MVYSSKNTGLRIRPSLICYILLLAAIDGYQTVWGFLSALIIHEAAHLLVGWIFHESFAGIELTPFGGVITYQAGKGVCKGVRGVLIASAGLCANYLILLFLACLRPSGALTHAVAIANASMLLVNLLPVLPLDGGRILFSIGYYLFPVAHLAACLGGLGVITGAALVLLALYGVVKVGTLNVSLLFVGGYIAFSARRNQQILLASEMYTVFNERMKQRDEVIAGQIYAVSGETVLFSLASLLCGTRAYVFVIDKETGSIAGEDILIRKMLSNPHQLLSSVFSETNAMQ